jgi:Formate hydrogenlyase subunit 4
MIEILLILFAPVIGGVLYGFERVVRARMQNRQGPPLLQPFYDMMKLLDKQTFIVNPTHALLGVMHFVALWAVVAFTIMGGNLLYIVFCICLLLCFWCLPLLA